MIKLFFTVICFLYAVILSSCAVKSNSIFIPVPDHEYSKQENNTIKIGDIIENKNGTSVENMPVWLSAYINGGIEEVERIYSGRGKYVFIGYNEGVNSAALNIWADNFSVAHDFTNLAADRIERRMISVSKLYPDDEYGLFFETMVKNAYRKVYSGAVKEDICWIKIKDDSGNGEPVFREVYNYFILVTMDKMTMQVIIAGMMEEANSAVTPTAAQRNAINRLRQTFFEEF
jgi:hypothetical protein